MRLMNLIMRSLYPLFLFLLILGSSCKNTIPQDPVPNHDSITISSTILDENRVINVWTPKNYETSSDSLPVMYMADGGIKEDFPHIANTLAKLIEEKKIKPLILVGIENTERRRDLTGVTEIDKDKEIAPNAGGSEKFRAFIRDELFTEIEKRYRTTAERSLIGESLSGLFVLETFFLSPELFTHYIAFDPSLWWNNHYLVRSATAHLEKFPIESKSLWYAGSSAQDITVYTNALAKILQTNSPSNVRWLYSDEPQEKHHTIFRATKEKALIWTFGK